MKYIFILIALTITNVTHAKSTDLHYDFSSGFYVLEHEIKPKRFFGLMYRKFDFSDDSYNYDGNGYGMSFSFKELIDSGHVNLLLAYADVDRNLCHSCIDENTKLYLWGMSAAYNWIWDWGLYIHLGLGLHFQYKTYSYRDSSFKGPQAYLPLGLGFAF